MDEKLRIKNISITMSLLLLGCKLPPFILFLAGYLAGNSDVILNIL